MAVSESLRSRSGREPQARGRVYACRGGVGCIEGQKLSLYEAIKWARIFAPTLFFRFEGSRGGAGFPGHRSRVWVLRVRGAGRVSPAIDPGLCPMSYVLRVGLVFRKPGNKRKCLPRGVIS